MGVIDLTKKDFKVGQEVYLRVLPSSNVARSAGRNKIIKSKVLTVGRQYITTEHSKFDMEMSFVDAGDYCKNYSIHLSERAVFEEIKKENNIKEIRTFFGRCGKINLSYAQTECILEILKSD